MRKEGDMGNKIERVEEMHELRLGQVVKFKGSRRDERYVIIDPGSTLSVAAITSKKGEDLTISLPGTFNPDDIAKILRTGRYTKEQIYEAYERFASQFSPPAREGFLNSVRDILDVGSSRTRLVHLPRFSSK
ncbi:MAG: hypothetical protein M1524_03650 [Patescibacteria group bacterium]|nr:hypothetical protein [Patescibacteria group bacterium]